MTDSMIELLCDEADQFEIKLIKEERKGAIYPTCRKIHINPDYWGERDETFIHEMLHFYHGEISCTNLGRNNETVIEMETQVLMKNPQNRNYVLGYLNRRFNNKKKTLLRDGGIRDMVVIK